MMGADKSLERKDMPQHLQPMWAPDEPIKPKMPGWLKWLVVVIILGTLVLIGGTVVWYELSGRPWWLLHPSQH